MARTAPVPNIPPIPGMCPSIAVMGGGGGGGGGGGKGGGPGDGSAGAAGDGSADGAGGDGSSAGSCGPGSGNGCSNPQHGNAGTTAAGDPVDVLTGRVFTVAARDLVLPGPIPLVFARSYSSTARARDVGLGHGWTHSLAWEVEVHRDRVTLWKADGRREVFDSLPVGEEGRTIDLVVRRHTSGFDVLRDRLRYELREVRGGQGSFSLSAIVDGYGNRIELGYDDRGRLAELRDSASRAVRLRWGDSGRIERVEAYNAAAQGQWCVFQRYVYDDVGDLVAATGAGGATHRYAYDRHLLVAHEAPTRRTTHYVYDASARCIETWVDYPGGADESLDGDVPRLLADGLTKAKGVLHVKIDAQDDYVEVADSRSVRRYFRNALGKFDKAVVGGGVSTNRYDPQGRLLAHTDPLGATWTWRLDPWGRLDSTTDPLGGETRYLYDAAGRLREALDPCGRRMRYDRNAQGDVTLESDDLGPLLRFAYDPRGLLTQITMPNGGSTFFEYDDQGNRVRVREPSGGERHIRYDYFGTPVACVDEHGAETRFLWDASHRLTSLRYADGSSVDFEFDALGRLTALRSARGQRFELRWSGFDAVVEVRRPNGTRVAFRYDREGELVRVVNENDEEHRIVRDGVGHVVEETTYDGRTLHYRVDKLGNLTRVRRASGRLVDFEYDALGRMVSRSFGDELVETFAYDSLGRVVRAAGAGVVAELEYDLRGRLTRETVRAGAETTTLEASYDELDNRVEARTSWGYGERVAYDRMGDPTELGLSAAPSALAAGARADVSFRRGVNGREVERRLDGRATLQHEYDLMGRFSTRRIVGGGATGATLWEQSFVFDADGSLLRTNDPIDRAVELAYDPVGQLVSRIPERARAELFSYDPAGALQDGRPRRYESGGRLVRIGATELAYDPDHNVISRTVTAEDGTKQVHRYEWDPRGRLAAVDLPDGTRATYRYDPFSRRIGAALHDAARRPIERERLRWDHDALSQVVRERAQHAGDPVIEERTFAYVPRTLAPVAERVVRSAETSTTNAPEWRYYVCEPSLRPELLVDREGAVIASFERDAWGNERPRAPSKESTPLRFAGHVEDAWTGLFYNRHRYYDPDIGRYLSPEPIGLEGGHRPFGYAENDPVLRVDPNGLEGMAATATGGGVTGTGSAAGRSGRGSRRQPKLHPAVQSCLLSPGDSLEPSRTGSGRHPASCAEPQAVSDYLYRRGLGNNASDEEIAAALRDMHLEAHEEGDPTISRAPCQNCSQFLANLSARFGAPRSSQVTAGRPHHSGGTPTNFTPPSKPTRADGTPNHTALPP